MDTTRGKKSTEDANELENSVKGKKDERKQTEHIKEKSCLNRETILKRLTGLLMTTWIFLVSPVIVINYHNGREL